MICRLADWLADWLAGWLSVPRTIWCLTLWTYWDENLVWRFLGTLRSHVWVSYVWVTPLSLINTITQKIIETKEPLCEIYGRWYKFNCGPVSQVTMWSNGYHPGISRHRSWVQISLEFLFSLSRPVPVPSPLLLKTNYAAATPASWKMCNDFFFLFSSSRVYNVIYTYVSLSIPMSSKSSFGILIPKEELAERLLY